MHVTPQNIRESLLANDRGFRKLAEEHSRCESQLEQLLKQPYLSSEDLALQGALKKMKLRLKDQMELIIAQHRNNLMRH